MTRIDNNEIEDLIGRRENHETDYFMDFLIALLSVDNRYLIWQYGINQQMSERVFAYELYHQWRLISERFNYRDIVINGEIRKDGSVLRHDRLGEVYPDLILHKQQNNMNQQLIACEIKTLRALGHANGKRQLKKDLIKLGNYTDELQFQFGLFVQVLDYDNFFTSKLIPYINRNQQDMTNLDRIYYIIKDHDNIRYDTLENIINNVPQ